MNPNKFLVTIEKLEEIDLYKKARVTNFLFPLKGFCVGIPNTFALEEIKEGYLYINQILDSESYQKLKRILKNITEKIKGIVFEDFGVITLAKELNLSQKLILYQTHFATNAKSINENLKFVDSIVIGTDITKEEMEQILEYTKKPLVHLLYGFIPAMYSRRTLLTNFAKEFQLTPKSDVWLEETISKKRFRAVENELGTMIYNDKYLNAQNHQLDDNKIFLYFIHPLFLRTQEKMKIIDDLVRNQKRDEKWEDEGFLNTKTIYRLKGDINE